MNTYVLNVILDHCYALPPAEQIIRHREYMHEVISELKGQKQDLLRKKRKLCSKNDAFLSKLAEVKEDLNDKVRVFIYIVF